MTGYRLAFFATLASLAWSGLLLAQERIERVQFPRGQDAATLSDRVRGDGAVTYLLGASAGQYLAVDMTTSNASLSFNVTAPGASEALFIGSLSGTRFQGVLPSSGDYRIDVYLMRNAARRNEVADFTLSVQITGTGPAPDFADGDAGGPDFWRVTGLAPNDTLNVRAGPSTTEPVVAQLAEGAVVRNMGCRSGGQRWCRIETNGLSGWVAGRFLREAPPPATALTPAPIPVPADNGVRGNGEPFTVTGAVPCATARSQPMRACPFGAIRGAPGEANVWIALGNGSERYILFEAGSPSFTDADTSMSFIREGDLLTIRIGTERFEIPDALVTGG